MVPWNRFYVLVGQTPKKTTYSTTEGLLIEVKDQGLSLGLREVRGVARRIASKVTRKAYPEAQVYRLG